MEECRPPVMLGGMDIEENEDYFAYSFFESMSWEFDNFGKYKER